MVPYALLMYSWYLFGGGCYLSMKRTPAWLYPVCLLLFVFTSLAAQQEPDTYKLGAGDHIIIQVFDEAELSMDFHLNHSGILNYPFLGELKVAGLSVL